MAAVALLNAEAGSTPSGTGSFSYFTNARVVLENLAFDKIVGIWGHNPASGSWGFFPCSFGRSVPNNREVWSARRGRRPQGQQTQALHNGRGVQPRRRR